jgi:hypothetical protein
MATEVTKEFDATLATFNGHPHYEIMATGQTYDGDDEVILEFDLLGTNLGEFYGMPPTGKAFYFDTASLVTQIGRGELLALATSTDD